MPSVRPVQPLEHVARLAALGTAGTDRGAASIRRRARQEHIRAFVGRFGCYGNHVLRRFRKAAKNLSVGSLASTVLILARSADFIQSGGSSTISRSPNCSSISSLEFAIRYTHCAP